MNISAERWTNFKQELPAILILSIMQVWMVFNFPSYYARLGSPWSTLFMVAISFIGIVCISFIFVFSERVVRFSYKSPVDYLLKNMSFACFFAMMNISILIAWYKDFYDMPNTYYVIFYGYYLLFFVLLARASNRNPMVIKNHFSLE
jgi:hypothetical protein